ncbi:hypothetical protein DP590_07355 [Salmonella enterica]|nr:hypothetical protein [Salmonella enterica]ECE0739817.1 hypothetical protein [Salmonella enterica subsp. enterica serovar Hvittingfoss]MJE82196.1 hypothetical protein [Salmonella enterica]
MSHVYWYRAGGGRECTAAEIIADQDKQERRRTTCNTGFTGFSDLGITAVLFAIVTIFLAM